MSWFLYYSAICLLSVLSLLILSYLAYRNPTLSFAQKSPFLLLFLSIFLGRTFEWISSSRITYSWGNATARKILRHIEYRFAPFVALFAGVVRDKNRISIGNLILCIGNIIFISIYFCIFLKASKRPPLKQSSKPPTAPTAACRIW